MTAGVGCMMIDSELEFHGWSILCISISSKFLHGSESEQTGEEVLWE
jgi:hypothetical protein